MTEATGRKGLRRGVLIVDFGTQYCQLIARRVREHGVFSHITTPAGAVAQVEAGGYGAIILSGGPRSVYEADAPVLDPAVLDRGLPVLGICYGMQWLSRALGGEVVPATGETSREYGHAELSLNSTPGPVFDRVAGPTQVWMSHGDEVATLPEGFVVGASTPTCPNAAAYDASRRIAMLQFHPEVTHTVEGQTILRNFLFDVAQLEADWSPGSIVEETVAALREQIGTGEVVLGLSGGVDSSVAAMLIHRAIGDRLHCVFVDNGLLRAGERASVEGLFQRNFEMDVCVVDASERFLEDLAGVTNPEKKRHLIGHRFVDVFREAASRYEDARFLGQGTLYPDVIESVAAHGGATSVIKSHHNVGGLPEDLGMELVEPLRQLFKDEVRVIGRSMDMPAEVIDRQPFPGPGLAVRIVGEITRERCELLRDADRIITTEIEAAGCSAGLWQYFGVLLPTVQSVGVMGDARTYENPVVLRAVTSADAMTADWAFLPEDLLRRISNRIINEVRGVNRVVLDITSKPPGTIEWE
ncbi:MAG: glutamine-hydrolyzing GMP synthase [Planctomycetes bacterium]|nr:glutamine-hydrolyzing GMP synthase [Planctomycetota bacterium]MDP6423410.1 glutamine-hydrolyzing GMP synthase [Planctomycetota bacterium]